MIDGCWWRIDDILDKIEVAKVTFIFDQTLDDWNYCFEYHSPAPIPIYFGATCLLHITSSYQPYHSIYYLLFSHGIFLNDHTASLLTTSKISRDAVAKLWAPVRIWHVLAHQNLNYVWMNCPHSYVGTSQVRMRLVFFFCSYWMNLRKSSVGFWFHEYVCGNPVKLER